MGINDNLKIIITLTGFWNYGSIMQRYALQSYLKKQGFNFKIKKLEFMEEKDEKYQHTKQFVDQNILEIDLASTDYEKIKTIIVGSDQVWRNWTNNDEIFSIFFLKEFENLNIRKISYAASFGGDTFKIANISQKEKERIKPMLEKFSAISVREESGIAMVKQLGARAAFNIDPTLLLIEEDYSKLIKKSYKARKHKIPAVFCYILDDNAYKQKIINKVCEQRDTQSSFVVNPNKDNPLYPVEIWLKGFRDSEIVITDSFHGMVFSIINKKDFFVFTNEKRGVARIYDFLKEVGLEDRIIYEGSRVSKNMISKSINYKPAIDKLKKARNRSEEWLINNI